MDKEVLRAVIGSDEAEALLVAEPFNCSSGHELLLCVCAADAEDAKQQRRRARARFARRHSLADYMTTVAARVDDREPNPRQAADQPRLDRRASPHPQIAAEGTPWQPGLAQEASRRRYPVRVSAATASPTVWSVAAACCSPTVSRISPRCDPSGTTTRSFWWR